LRDRFPPTWYRKKFFCDGDQMEWMKYLIVSQINKMVSFWSVSLCGIFGGGRGGFLVNRYAVRRLPVAPVSWKKRASCNGFLCFFILYNKGIHR
jgi:hypothetical protein